MKIHTIGDSHSVMGFNTVYGVSMHYVGPRLAYSVGRDGQASLDITNYNIENGDIIIFVFGEIDTRCHVQKFITEDITYQMVIDDIIKSYLSTINDIIQQYDKIYTCIYNIVPPVYKDKCSGNDAFPFRGSDHERQKFILYFNAKLREECMKYNFTFFDVYDKYCDKDGFLNPELSDGNVHIRDGVYIREFLDKLCHDITET